MTTVEKHDRTADNIDHWEKLRHCGSSASSKVQGASSLLASRALPEAEEAESQANGERDNGREGPLSSAESMPYVGLRQHEHATTLWH